MYVCVWQNDTLTVCILLQPTHRLRLLSSHLALSADFTKKILSSPVHIVCIDCSQNLLCELHFDIFFKLDNEASLINLMFCLSLKEGGEICIIGRAKRAPHWGVQSRFHVIYIYMLVCMSAVCQNA